jgi:hypothetical protein
MWAGFKEVVEECEKKFVSANSVWRATWEALKRTPSAPHSEHSVRLRPC